MIIRTANGDIENIIAVLPFTDYEDAKMYIITLEKVGNGFGKRRIPLNDVGAIFADADTAKIFDESTFYSRPKKGETDEPK